MPLAVATRPKTMTAANSKRVIRAWSAVPVKLDPSGILTPGWVSVGYIFQAIVPIRPSRNRPQSRSTIPRKGDSPTLRIGPPHLGQVVAGPSTRVAQVDFRQTE